MSSGRRPTGWCGLPCCGGQTVGSRCKASSWSGGLRGETTTAHSDWRFQHLESTSPQNMALLSQCYN
ncbi:hypothetical protein MHYP_G00151350 [Metynnis hypsauchen]